MKGLMIKDLKLMKNQKSFAVIFAAVILFYLFTEVTAAIIIGYACIVSAMFTVGTLSYDDLDNGNAFLFTLPFARKSYAAEKYILTILTNIIVWTVSTALAIVFDLHRVPDLVLSEYIFTALLIAALTFLLNAVMIPTQMKFGGNRGIIEHDKTNRSNKIMFISPPYEYFHVDLSPRTERFSPSILRTLPDAGHQEEQNPNDM